MDASRRYPEPYDFLYVAGAIDRGDPASAQTKRCARSLRMIAGLNGSFKLLDAEFRADYYEALGCRCETKAKLLSATLAQRCDSPADIPPEMRSRTREHFVRLSRFWPERPQQVLPA